MQVRNISLRIRSFSKLWAQGLDGDLNSIYFYAVLVVALWYFPVFWYNNSSNSHGWKLGVDTSGISNSIFINSVVDPTEKKILLVDDLISGQYKPIDTSCAPITIYLATVNDYDPRAVSLFAHTPDRCWTEGGWVIRHIYSGSFNLLIGGRKFTFEKRIFDGFGHSELVFFTGVVSGSPLPFRLDYNYPLNIEAIQLGIPNILERGWFSGDSCWRRDPRLIWRPMWESFVSRKKLDGSIQFLRVSTQVVDGRVDMAERRLEDFLYRALRFPNYNTNFGG